ncbi:M24 family metallopeptidase [Corynebacterium choanae]|uniref:Xaa-Pro dipeptidase n=1 Tax=Corynebacterium choanae TaxID=1862358 RepID=A0A3G6J6H3_9CORY|nr:Xaa-Pro peptidase family protein [Corynebacterium choanae]AZA13556.1 Xaa-Pro dipeptidase [Corynebacterium choanae]
MTTTASISSQTYQSRQQRAAQLLAQTNIADALIVTPGATMRYFLGDEADTHERLSALIIPQSSDEQRPVHCQLITPAVDAGTLAALPGTADINIIGYTDDDHPHATVISLVQGEGHDPHHMRLAVDGHMPASHLLTLQNILGNRPQCIVAATPIVSQLTMLKDPAEITHLQTVGAAIDEVHALVPQLLQPGRTEAEVAAALHTEILNHGHTAVDFVIVGSGPNGANPHHEHSNRTLQTGEMVVVDIGGADSEGYRSDCTRTYIVGGADAARIDPEMDTMYEVLVSAQAAARQAAVPGARAKDVDDAARRVISDAGYGQFFVHRTGHGIGLSTHEEPFITSTNELVLEPGMAFSIEPGIYLPGRFGARIEDIVIISDDGHIVCNNQPRMLR